MVALRRLASAVCAAFRRDRFRADADEELRAYLQAAADDKMRSGMAREDAIRAARVEMGSLEAIKEAVSEVAWGPALESLLRDVRHSLRALRRSPGFATVAVLTVALGIGSTTAVLSVMNAALRPRLPYTESSRLIDVYNRNLDVAGNTKEFVSLARWRDWQQRGRTIADLAAFTDLTAFNLSGAGEATRVRGAAVSANMLAVLGIRPVLGRDFFADDGVAGHDHVVMLSDRLWASSFQRRPDVVGQAIQLDREPYTIVGILPTDFQLGTLRSRADVLLPIPSMGPEAERRDRASVDLVGRLAPGVSVETARAALSSISDQLALEFPDTDRGWGVTVIPLASDLEPMIRSRLEIFLGLAVLILLVACVNVAVLMIARTEARAQQLRVRVALGASRMQLLRYRLSESVVIAVLGGALAVLLAGWGVRVLIAYSPTIQHVAAAPIDWHVLAAVVVLGLAAAVLLGTLSGVVRILPADTLLDAAHHRVASRQRWQMWLVGAEMALSLALVATAGLLAKSLNAVTALDLGFDPSHLVYARVTLDSAAYRSGAERVAFVDRLVATLSGDPRMEVTAGSAAPFGREWVGNHVQVPGRASTGRPNALPYCFSAFVRPGYFHALRNPIVEGRDFQTGEREPVVIINQAMARQLFPDQDPIGRSLTFLPNTNVAYDGASAGTRRIVGVVRNVDESRVSYNMPTHCVAFFSYAQNPSASVDLMVRALDDGAAVSALRREVARADPAEPLYNVHLERDQVDEALRPWRFQSWFAGLAAALALLLSGIGVYGMVHHAVRLRTREIGIRIALGGRPSAIVGWVMKAPIGAISLGACLGLLGAWALSRQVSSLLFQVSALDPTIFGASVIILAGIGLVAAFLPARRATVISPVSALRVGVARRPIDFSTLWWCRVCVEFRNVYDEAEYAAAYAALDWSGTYFLVRRDLPGILARHVSGRRALDFGCGTGRSSRLLTACGFDVVGVDVAEPMVERARRADPQGRYLCLHDGDLDQLDGHFDLVLAAFPFDNIPNARKPALLQSIARRLAPAGRFVNVVSSPDIYCHEWASFSTREYPENAQARDGDVVRIVTREFGQPAEDILCGPDTYRTIYERSGLDIVATYQPLGAKDDGPEWVSETQVAPWTIDVLRRADAGVDKS